MAIGSESSSELFRCLFTCGCLVMGGFTLSVTILLEDILEQTRVLKVFNFKHKIVVT